MLTKAGVGICRVFVKLVAVVALIPGAGIDVKATGCCTAVVMVGTNGGGVVGVAIIFPLAVVILPTFVFVVVVPAEAVEVLTCWPDCAFGDLFWYGLAIIEGF